MQLSVEGKVAIITGAGRGLGQAIAIAMAEAGANIACVARNASQLEETAKQVRALGREAMVISADVTDSKQVDEMVAQTTKQFGQVDILVNNAGTAVVQPLIPLPGVDVSPGSLTNDASTPMTDNDIHRCINTNLVAAFYCCRAVGPHMQKQQQGRIINISSVAAQMAIPYHTIYAATKAGIQAFTQVLALEWARYKINVNAISPGSIVTPMNEKRLNDPKVRAERVARIPWNRFGEPREIGLLAVFLASDAANYITGQVLSIDGGHSVAGGGVTSKAPWQ